MLEAAPGEPELDFALRRPAVLLLRALDARSGRTLDPREVEFWWKEEGHAELRRVDWGWARQPVDEDWTRILVPNGALELEAWPSSGELCPVRGRKVKAALDDEPARVEFALGPGVELRLQRDAASGALPRGHALVLLEESARDAVRSPVRRAGDEFECGPGPLYESASTQPFVLRQVVFDPAGSAVVRALSPGRHCLRVFPADLALEPDVFDVAEAGANEFTVRWRVP